MDQTWHFYSMRTCCSAEVIRADGLVLLCCQDNDHKYPASTDFILDLFLFLVETLHLQDLACSDPHFAQANICLFCTSPAVLCPNMLQ